MSNRGGMRGGRWGRFRRREGGSAGAVLCLVLALLAGGMPRAAGATEPGGARSDTAAVGSQVSVDQVAGRLMDPCPDCKGKLLAGCDCGGAREAKDEIRAQLAAGKSEQEIVQAFRKRYGDWILAVPEPKGFNRLGYLLPAALFALGGIALAAFLRRAVQSKRGIGSAERQEPGRPAAAPDLPESYVLRRPARAVMSTAERARLENELRLLDE